MVWKFGVVPPIPVDGLLVRGAAPAVEATSIKPHATKPMEVSFIGPPSGVQPLEGQMGFLDKVSLLRIRKPETARTGVASAKK